MQAAQLWHDWAMIQGILEDEQLLQHQQSAAEPAVHWQQPPPGFMKCNVDASFYDTAEATGWGWCLRDYRGRFILAGTNLMHTKLKTLEGEAMGNKEAIEEMMQRGLSYVIFESDS
ncbi:cytochrome p450, partial [Trifolium pratense]